MRRCGGCSRRAAKLHLPPGARYFACRRCYDLTYTSCQDSHRFDAVYSSHDFGEPKESAGFWPRLAARESFDPARTLFADDSPAVLRAARGHGIRWLYAVRRPVRSAPARGNTAFAGVESVLELAEGLA